MSLPGTYSRRNTVDAGVAASRHRPRHRRGGRQSRRFGGRLLGGILLGLAHHSRLTKESVRCVPYQRGITGHCRCWKTTSPRAVSYTHLRAHETDSYLVCRLLLEKKKKQKLK